MSRKIIFGLACNAMDFEPGAREVLGDAVLRYDYYDNMLFHCYGLTEEQHFKEAAGLGKDKPPSFRWAACVGAVLLCGAWEETIWVGMLTSWSGSNSSQSRRTVSRYSFGLPVVTIAPGGTGRTAANPETNIRCKRLLLIPSAIGLMVTAIQGANVNMIVGGAVPAEEYGPGRYDNIVGLPTLGPANTIQIQFFNPTQNPITVVSSLRGESADTGYEYSSHIFGMGRSEMDVFDDIDRW